MSLSSLKTEEPERYYEWMHLKSKQEDLANAGLEKNIQDRIERSNEYMTKTVDAKANQIIVLEDRIKQLEVDMAYMKKEIHEE